MTQPTVSPLPTCTADALRTAGPCSQLDFDAQQGLQRRYHEAEKVLREVIAEEDRLYLARATEPSQRLKELTLEPFLLQKAPQFRSSSERTLKAEGGPTIVTTTLSRHARRKGATVSICASLDSRSMTFFGKDGSKAPGNVYANDYFFIESEGKLRLLDANGRGGSECDH